MSMKTRVAIYGFCRLGRAVFTVAARRSDLEVVAISTDMVPEDVKAALDDDCIYGSLKREITTENESVIVDGKTILLVPTKLSDQWKKHDISIVIDCTNIVASQKITAEHQTAGAQRVVFAATGEGIEEIILAVNEEDLPKSGDAISCGSPKACAVLPLREILAELCGIEHSLITTIDGNLDCSDAACSCDCGETCNCEGGCTCETETLSTNVPVPKLVASCSEFVFVSKHTVTTEKIIDAISIAAKAPYYQGIIAISDEPVVGDQAIGESVSGLVDLSRIEVEGGHLVSIKIWYDREWSYANRIVEVTADYAKLARGSAK